MNKLTIEVAKILTLNELELKFYFMFLRQIPLTYNYLDKLMYKISRTFPTDNQNFNPLLK